jgi:hypothetical protein
MQWPERGSNPQAKGVAIHSGVYAVTPATASHFPERPIALAFLAFELNQTRGKFRKPKIIAPAPPAEPNAADTKENASINVMRTPAGDFR